VNSGTISGGTNGDGSGIALGASFSGNSDALVNLGSGVINGGVSMTGSNNSVTLFTGSVINGALNMGADTQSLLTLGGAGTSLFSSAVTGTTTFVGGLTKQGAGIWTIDRTLNASSVTISAGTLQVGNGGTTGTLGAGNVANSGTLVFNRSDDSTYSGIISGSGAVTKSGIGRLSLSGSSSYNGATAVSAGELNLSGGSIANSAVTVASGASLGGYGSVGTIGGAGAINPGNSPGILTTPQVDPLAGTDFNFEMTGIAPTYNNASNSVNDVIRITGLTPFSAPLAAYNSINIYFSGDALFTGSPKTITGGFFTDQSASFASSITSATYNYYFANAIGTNSYNGVNYYSKAQYETAVLSSNLMTITVTTVAQAADFGSGNVNGQVMQIDVIPEPSTYALLVLAVATWGAHAWRRRKSAKVA
jgi:autotransporter-associated beta strand protein